MRRLFQRTLLECRQAKEGGDRPTKDSLPSSVCTLAILGVHLVWLLSRLGYSRRTVTIVYRLLSARCGPLVAVLLAITWLMRLLPSRPLTLCGISSRPTLLLFSFFHSRLVKLGTDSMPCQASN